MSTAHRTYQAFRRLQCLEPHLPITPLRASTSASTRISIPASNRGQQVRWYQTSPSRSADSTIRLKHTTDTYPGLTRDARFKRLDEHDVRFFHDLLGPSSATAVIDGVTRDATDELEAYNADWMRKYRGRTKLVLKPQTTRHVSEILRYCNEKLLAVNPQGGNTGLVGGSVPVFDEIVVNLARMNSIRSFDDVSGILVADAGVVLEAADGFLADKGYVFPLDLGAKGSCQLGGNVATNAGGLRLLRYGSLHGNILGLEAVLPDGTIVDDLCQLRKNNTGYDLKQLFIGGEGTIGIVTGLSIVCPQRSPAVNVAYLGLESYEKAQQAFKSAKSQLSEILSAFEMMDGASQELYVRATGAKLPLESPHPFYCLVETSGSNADHDEEKLSTFLESVMGDGTVADGVLAQDESQLQTLWACREGVSEASQHWGGVYKYDLSIPLPQLYDLVDATRQRMRSHGLLASHDDGNQTDSSHPVVDVIGYGHMGDSNLHLNVATRGYDGAVEAALEPFVYEWVRERKGSISAEHGLGLAKKAFVGYSRSETMVRLMRELKRFYDPVIRPFLSIKLSRPGVLTLSRTES